MLKMQPDSDVNVAYRQYGCQIFISCEPNLASFAVGFEGSYALCGSKTIWGARTEFPQTPGIIWLLLPVYVEEKVAFTPGEEVNFQEHRPMHLVTDQPQWRFRHRFNLDLG